MPIIFALLILALVTPLLVGTTLNNQMTLNQARNYADRATERQVVWSALQSIVADIATKGGAYQMEQVYSNSGLVAYTFTNDETMVGKTNPVIRIWATVRPLDSKGSNVSTNNNIIGTATYDPIERFATSVRYFEKRRKN